MVEKSHSFLFMYSKFPSSVFILSCFHNAILVERKQDLIKEGEQKQGCDTPRQL